MANEPMASQIDLPRLHACQLRVAELVRAICARHGIPYFLIAGTLLGAVRHGGFIPWDDDLDMGMLRPDFDRFMALAQQELGPDYFVQSTATDPHMPLPFAKVRINGTVLREAGSRDCQWHRGIFIDIFPFDGVPPTRLRRWAHKCALTLVARMLVVKSGFSPMNDGKGWGKRLAYALAIHPLARLVPRPLQVRLLDRLARACSGTPTAQVIATGGAYGYDREIVERAWVSTQDSVAFCGSQFSCPAGWEAYLRNLYGDYMQLPPVERRFNRHGIIELDFGKE